MGHGLLDRTPSHARSSLEIPLEEQVQGILVGELTDAGTCLLSPLLLGELLGLELNEVMARALSGTGPLAANKCRDLQCYLHEVLIVLAKAEAAAGGNRTRAVRWFMTEPIECFNNFTADQLVTIGKTQAVLDYIDSITSGA